MNINETLAEYFEGTTHINDGTLKESIPKFLRELKKLKKYECSQKLLKELLEHYGKDQLDSHITELYEVEVATLSLTGKRDHVIHALNTFLLGFYINDKINFKVKSNWIRRKISKRIKCLNDSNVIVENDTIINGTSL